MSSSTFKYLLWKCWILNHEISLISASPQEHQNCDEHPRWWQSMALMADALLSVADVVACELDSFTHLLARHVVGVSCFWQANPFVTRNRLSLSAGVPHECTSKREFLFEHPSWQSTKNLADFTEVCFQGSTIGSDWWLGADHGGSFHYWESELTFGNLTNLWRLANQKVG